MVWPARAGGESLVLGRRLDRDGRPVGEELVVHDDETSASRQIRLAIDPGDRPWVMWTSGTVEGSDVFGRLLGATGQPLSATFRVNGLPLDLQRSPRLAIDATGRALVIWQSREALVKVLDGCAFNDHFWVFSAATTDVEYTLQVTDTASGEVREYFNALGVAAPALTDTSAFATCAPR